MRDEHDIDHDGGTHCSASGESCSVCAWQLGGIVSAPTRKPDARRFCTTVQPMADAGVCTPTTASASLRVCARVEVGWGWGLAGQ